jgi:DEAD/DEAH box helicase domain-containing protein
MAQLDAMKLVEAVTHRLVDLASDECFMRDEAITAICRRLWAASPEKGGLVSDLWVEGAFPAEIPSDGPRSLADLVQIGSFDQELAAHLDNTGSVPRSRLLYTHQRDAILQAGADIQKRPGLIITAGTGAGKTECFLLPVLNQLYRHSRRMNANGVRAIILYPMNALVNDQVDRLYSWLQGQERVTLFHFTSETPEARKALGDLRSGPWDPCRFSTRQHARGLEKLEDGHLRAIIDGEPRGPVPDVLITNYSMLEYMLCRPQDEVFFGSALEAIVLDEAHLYTGTLAAEITLLLRRVLDRCAANADHVLHIATSATLGSNTLRQFARDIFGKSDELVHVIQGQPRRAEVVPSPVAPTPTLEAFAKRRWLDWPTLRMTPAGETEMVVETDETRWQQLLDDLATVASSETIQQAAKESGHMPARLLFLALRTTPLVARLEDLLWNRRQLKAEDLAHQLWGDDAFGATPEPARQATLMLLRLCAAARQGVHEYPLVPHRLHVLARSPEGLWICLNPHCDCSLEERLPGFGRLLAGYHPHCPTCGSSTLAIWRCDNCGEPVLVGMPHGHAGLTAPKPVLETGVSGGIRVPAVAYFFTWRTDAQTGPLIGLTLDGERVGAARGEIRYRQLGGAGRPTVCPNCGISHTTQESAFTPATFGTSLALSVVAETMLAELPELSSDVRASLPARGRRLLAFTDGRQGAARLGPRLTNQHEMQMLRTALVRALPTDDPAEANVWRSLIAQLETTLAAPLPDAAKFALEKQLTDYRKNLLLAKVGYPLDFLASRIAQTPVAAEFIDWDTAEKHRLPWPERNDNVQGPVPHTTNQWEANRAAIATDLARRLKCEVARPLRSARIGNLESLGLIEVAYPGIDQIPSPTGLIAEFPGLAGTAWSELLKVICDTLRYNGALTLSGRYEEDQLYDIGGVPIGFYIKEDEFQGRQHRQRRRALIGELLVCWGVGQMDHSAATDRILCAVWEMLVNSVAPGQESLRWLEVKNRSLRINLSHLAITRPRTLYFSPRTGHVFAHAIPCNDKDGSEVFLSDGQGCSDLRPVSLDLLRQNPRFARKWSEYSGANPLTNRLFETGLWAEEHTAQLSPHENRRLQDLFKSGVRNILSSTTTLELGIDIGGLAGALLTDVPPGKANYLQRAGRAGRRADGSSIVLTFARQRPFDRQVFTRFDSYLDTPLRDPTVFLSRKRIAMRHANALLLGEFFREEVNRPGARTGAMTAFRQMGEFCRVPYPFWWGDQPHRPPARTPEPPNELPFYERFGQFVARIVTTVNHPLRNRIRALMRDCGPMAAENRDESKFESFLSSVHTRLMADVITPWLNDYKTLLASWNEIPSHDSDQRSMANALQKSCQALYELTTIEALAEAQFLPRYGFPIGVMQLKVFGAERHGQDGPLFVREEDQYRLERAGILALREYTPGSVIVAGGKAIRSRGLMKHWTGADLPDALGITGRGGSCRNGHFHYSRDGSLADACPFCGVPITGNFVNILFPKHGFSSAYWDPPKRSISFEQVGAVQVATSAFVPHQISEEVRIEGFAGVAGLALRMREGAKLLVYNPGERVKAGATISYGGFAICTACGYTEAERVANGQGAQQLPSGFENHKPLRRMAKRCWQGNQSPVMRNRYLAAEQVTDAVLAEFPGQVPSEILETLAIALRLGGARVLGLDSRELGSMVIPTGQEQHGILLYDNHPGGAGHVLELAKITSDSEAEGPNIPGRPWLVTTLDRTLYVDAAHHQRCRTGCLDCLLTFDFQPAGPNCELNRPAAYEFLSSLLETQRL